ncbi:MAG: hypothetical protein CBB76_02790 [Crocinitomicaceae bacterium TMED16]|nr:MAG: hypothetical protein CBB76_02790 [Crocinitomicaceae bacterium TMED16]
MDYLFVFALIKSNFESMIQEIFVGVLILGAVSFAVMKIFRLFNKSESCESCAFHKAQNEN